MDITESEECDRNRVRGVSRGEPVLEMVGSDGCLTRIRNWGDTLENSFTQSSYRRREWSWGADQILEE